MSKTVLCAKKDLREIIRKKRTVVFNVLIFAVSIMVLGTTLAYPSLIEALTKKAPNVIEDGSQILQVMQKLFPQTTRENMGIWSSDVVIFSTIVISLICCNLIPEEIKTGKWILPIEAGYSKENLLFSKMLIYGICTALPTFIGYNLYYALSSLLITDNYASLIALGNSIVLAVSVFFVTTISISLSVICKNQISAVITVIMFVLAAPDILSLFSFGRFFPTYSLTFLYNSSSNFQELIIPYIVLLAVQMALWRISLKKLKQIEIAR